MGSSPAARKTVRPPRNVRLDAEFAKGRRERAEVTASEGQDRARAEDGEDFTVHSHSAMQFEKNTGFYNKDVKIS